MQITTQQLTKMYRQHTAIADLTLSIGPGMHGLLGANGAGKTTLMRILAGVITPSSGRVLADGQPLDNRTTLRAYQRRLGYLPQEPGLYPDLTCAETLDYIAAVKGIRDRAARRKHVEETLSRVGLSDNAKRRTKALSGGMRQRLGIGQALIADPSLLIVDEPTAGLDPRERARLRDLLASLAGAGHSILLSTHVVDDIATGCPPLTVLDRGRLRYHGPTDAFIGTAAGRVWTFTTTIPPDSRDARVVSSVMSVNGTQYRAVADQPPTVGAQPATATLEDAYLALLNTGNHTTIQGADR
jgi:ABC-type multidrug transport system ATPase subunit